MANENLSEEENDENRCSDVNDDKGPEKMKRYEIYWRKELTQMNRSSF